MESFQAQEGSSQLMFERRHSAGCEDTEPASGFLYPTSSLSEAEMD